MTHMLKRINPDLTHPAENPMMLPFDRSRKHSEHTCSLVCFSRPGGLTLVGYRAQGLEAIIQGPSPKPSFLQQGSARGHHTAQRIPSRGISVVVMATSVDAARPFTRTAPADSCVSVLSGGLAALRLSLPIQLQWLPDSRCVSPTEAGVVGGQSGTEGMPVCALVLTG